MNIQSYLAGHAAQLFETLKNGNGVVMQYDETANDGSGGVSGAWTLPRTAYDLPVIWEANPGNGNDSIASYKITIPAFYNNAAVSAETKDHFILRAVTTEMGIPVLSEIELEIAGTAFEATTITLLCVKPE